MCLCVWFIFLCILGRFIYIIVCISSALLLLPSVSFFKHRIIYFLLLNIPLFDRNKWWSYQHTFTYLLIELCMIFWKDKASWDKVASILRKYRSWLREQNIWEHSKGRKWFMPIIILRLIRTMETVTYFAILLLPKAFVFLFCFVFSEIIYIHHLM